jgi:plastocyanin
MRKIWFALAWGGAALLACSSTPTAVGICGGNFPGGVIIVTAGDSKTFSPQHVTANAGQAVCFQNTGTLLHQIQPDSVFATDSVWAHSGPYPLPPNLPVVFQLASGRDYYFHCTYHGGNQTGMWGIISVR